MSDSEGLETTKEERGRWLKSVAYADGYEGAMLFLNQKDTGRLLRDFDRLASEGETLRRERDEARQERDAATSRYASTIERVLTRAEAAESDNSRLRGKVEEAVKVHKRLSSAIARLGTVKDGKPLFESSPSKDPDCYDAWVELNEAQRDARGEKVKRFSEAWLRDKILDDQDDPQAGPEITP